MSDSLLTAWQVKERVFLVIGDSPFCRKRVTTIESRGGKVVQLAEAKPQDILAHGRPEVNNVCDGVFIVAQNENQVFAARAISEFCQKHRVPVNVADHPELCTFSLPSTHTDGLFQLAVTTGGAGCRLANRIKRTTVASLPHDMGFICQNIKSLREEAIVPEKIIGRRKSHDDDAEQDHTFNELALNSDGTLKDEDHPSRWLSQVVEYYPMERLASLASKDLEAASLHGLNETARTTTGRATGRIALIGAGPGSVGLLTTEALQEIQAADYILADKLVPEAVLKMCPKRATVFIAKKFPGNAERAQEELLENGLEALQRGDRVIRLKQGDPYVFGRGAEEYQFFKDHGYTPKVVAGVTSALAAPLLAGIPSTHRGFADQVLICTGTGRAGAQLQAPEFVKSRTTVFLMALHRIKDIVQTLGDANWDLSTPCASIERASCPDQRVVRSTLGEIANALEAVGSRPPGLLVVGDACSVLHPTPEKWVVEEGLA